MKQFSFKSLRAARAFPAFSLTAILGLLGLSCTSAPVSDTAGNACPAPAPAQSNCVRVITRREGDVTRFFVRNDEYCEVTMTFEMHTVNLKGTAQFPYTGTFPGRKEVEAFALSPAATGASWAYDYTNYYKLGSALAKPDESFIYELPYAGGSRFKVTQGYNGKFSHQGSNQYAIDWKMPEGTLVRAARGGVVVKVKDDSDTGGPSMAFDHFNNYVLIRHSDGTLGHYCHLKKGGMLVKVGQTVATGQPLAHSGNTGFSSGPHLHFCVFKTRNGRERISIPVKFETTSGKAITLVEGDSYRATDIQTASAAGSAPDSQGASVLQ